jgi:energy-coupling factor transporter ATP-binding protein EcfA2
VPARRRTAVFALGIEYQDPRHIPLEELNSGAQRLLDHFVGAGFEPHAGCMSLASAETHEITTALEGWCDGIRDAGLDSAIAVYIGGHGRLHDGCHYVLSASSPLEPPYSSKKALSAVDVVQFLLNSRASAGLVLLDACFAGFAAHQIQAAVDQAAQHGAGSGADIAILVPALHHERAYSGLFVHGLIDSLLEGSAGGFWRDGDEFVTVLEMRDELRHRFEDDQTAYTAGRDGLKILLNPRYRASAADRPTVLGSLLPTLTVEAQQHFLEKASGGDPDDVGWYFTGRAEPWSAVIDWLEAAEEGVLVVTGAPGSGKSALLGRISVLADRESQHACRVLGLFDCGERRPAIGVFDAVIHLKGMRTAEAARTLLDALGLSTRGGTNPARELEAALLDSGRHITVLADGLDEAEFDEAFYIARDLLRVVASVPGCRVIVGTRRDLDGRDATPLGEHGPLIAALAPRDQKMTIVDLDNDSESESDISRYVRRRLSEADAWCEDEQLLQMVADEVSRQAEGVFFYARCATRALKEMEGPQPRTAAEVTEMLRRVVGPNGLHEMFAQDLERVPDVEMVRDAFLALALACGQGLPRRDVWPMLATTVAANRGATRAYSAADIARVIRDAGWYLSEGTMDGEAIFRLFHQSLGDYLMGDL